MARRVPVRTNFTDRYVQLIPDRASELLGQNVITASIPGTALSDTVLGPTLLAASTVNEAGFAGTVDSAGILYPGMAGLYLVVAQLNLTKPSSDGQAFAITVQTDKGVGLISVTQCATFGSAGVPHGVTFCGLCRLDLVNASGLQLKFIRLNAGVTMTATGTLSMTLVAP
jgi:hypothetical protein